MKINVAGAGAGKTTGLANEIIEKHKSVFKNKNIYCLAFTNSAVASIKEKLQMHYGIIPNNIVVSTIHSFFYHEFISPYYFLLFGKHYKSISTIHLPSEQAYKNRKLMELENKDILHIEKIPERAKWVTYKKSTDKAREKSIRASIVNSFLTYCDTIYVDEAQDIDSDMKEIFYSLDKSGATLVFNGDPKQDIRGYGCFREMINQHREDVTYNSTCHRSPEEHLKITNSLIPSEEKQVAQKDGGKIELVFEKECCLNELMSKDFDLKFIYKKNDRFDTHSERKFSLNFDNLYYEIHSVLSSIPKGDDIAATNYLSYQFAKIIIGRYKSGESVSRAIKPFCDYVGKLEKEQYAKICSTFSACDLTSGSAFVVNSIESVKGLEGENCLFILTTDLAAYLFRKKSNENKIKNALYVALTRSLNSLTILVTNEVEEEYGKQKIFEFLLK